VEVPILMSRISQKRLLRSIGSGALVVAAGVGEATVMAPAASASTDFYVATTGTDSGSCSSPSSPCLTIAYAVSQATLLGGGTINVGPGNYVTNATIDLSSNITVAGAGALSTTVGGTTSSPVSGPVFEVVGQEVSITGLQITEGTGLVMDSEELGGGIYNVGTITTLSQDTISYNTATDGGGIYNAGTIDSLSQDTIAYNTATDGGGIYGYDGNIYTLTQDTISYNAATDGGGIYASNDGTSNTLSQDTISGNTASVDGGGIYNTAAISLNHDTVSDNTADLLGGGIFNDGVATIEATIVADNSGNNCDLDRTITDDGYNLDDDTTPGTCSFMASTDVVGLVPGLETLLNNGGPTDTQAIGTSSSAYDVIPSSSGYCAGDDQRGVPYLQGPATGCDIGAFQFAPPVITNISPNQGPPAGHTSVTLTGYGFTLATQVTFQGTIPFSVTGDTTITFSTPTGSAGVDVPVTVTNPDGTSNPETFSYVVNTQAITFNPPMSALFGYTLTLYATGGGSGNPVTFSLDATSTEGACALSGANNSVVTFTEGGNCVIDANQAGNSDYLAAPTVTRTIEVIYSSPCLSMSGYHGLIVRSGEAMCLSSSAVVIGPITVQSGGSLDIEGATVYGSINSDGAGEMRICGAQINGAVSLSSTVALVLIGGLEGSNCAGNSLHGPVSVTDNTAGVEFDYNTVDGPLTITGNTGSVGLFGDTVTGTENIQ
jgi:hypothetical protein